MIFAQLPYPRDFDCNLDQTLFGSPSSYTVQPNEHGLFWGWTRLRVNENGRVVIPASFRKALGINVGDEIVLRIEDDELRITTQKRRVERAQRLVRKHVKPGT